MTTCLVLLASLSLILAGSCIMMTVLLATTPPQGAVSGPSIALPGEPDFFNEKFWINHIVQPPAAERDLRALLLCILPWVIAGAIIILSVLQVTYIRQHGLRKKHHCLVKSTCGVSENCVLSVLEDAWSAVNLHQGSENQIADNHFSRILSDVAFRALPLLRFTKFRLGHLVKALCPTGSILGILSSVAARPRRQSSRIKSSDLDETYPDTLGKKGWLGMCYALSSRRKRT